MLIIRYLSFILMALLVTGMVFSFAMLMRSWLAPNKRKGKDRAMPSDAGLRELIQEHKLEEAIELYRRFTGIDEFTARKKVEDLAREMRLSDENYQTVKQILKAEGKAAAIQADQMANNANLEDALAYVEDIEKGKK
jgi:hypothetical protein